MKRVAIFAHYDKDNIIDDYVLIYLKELKKHCQKIIFVSDSDLPDFEIKKLEVDKIISGRHGEYDFGSYKRGFEFVDSDTDQLVLCNDSCYCIGDLSPIFKQKADFFGIVANKNIYSLHLQSFFLVLNKKVWQDIRFRNFMSSITKLKTKEEIVINYEVGLTDLLVSAGFSFSSLFGTFEANSTLTEEYFRVLRPKMPLLKTDLLKTNPIQIYGVSRKWKKGVSDNNIEIIEKHLNRMIGNKRDHLKINIIRYFISTRRVTFLGRLLENLISLKIRKNKLILRIARIKIFSKKLN